MSWPAPGAGGAGGAPIRPGLYTPQQPPPPPHNTQAPVHPQYSNYQTPPGTQQQYWSQPTQPQPQQQLYTQQGYPTNNANNYYQYNQTPNNQTGYQQNYAAPAVDGWEDNTWGDWGWDERTSQHKIPHQNPQQHTQDNLNANVLEESFGRNESWSWAASPSVEPPPPVGSFVDSGNVEQAPLAVEPPSVPSLGDRDAVRERRPDLALGKRIHLEQLTPQWSVESQMSQESSDGAAVHSADPSARTSPAPELPLHSQPSDSNLHDQHDPTLQHSGDVRDGIANALNDLNINNENPIPDNILCEFPSDFEASVEQAAMSTATETVRPPSLPPPQICPPSSGQAPFKRAGPLSHKNISNPVGLAPITSQQSIHSLPQNDSVMSQLSPSLSLSSRALPHAHLRNSSTYPTANLETPPDNSERPDQPPSSYHTSPAMHPTNPPLVDNLESAPQHDRNEYLQTAHLSGHYGEYRRGAETGEAEEPPPGLARMVPGQQTEPPPDPYLERRVDGQMDARGQLGRGDGRRTPDDTFSQVAGARGLEHRPVGMDRTVPGEFVQQFPAANDVRVVTGVDRDLNVDGSDYTEGGGAGVEAGARNAEGENLQDLSIVSSTDMSFRDQRVDGADLEPEPRATETNEASTVAHRAAPPAGHRVPTSGEETDRDRAFKASPRRDKRRGSREGYRGEEREGERRREVRDEDRREERRHRRYDTEDTDYNSDREREHRRYRGSSYSSTKPPRPDDRERRHRDERSKHYATIERERGYDERDRDRSRRYRDEPRGYSSLRRDRRRGDTYGGPAARPDSRDPDPTEDELNETMGSDRRDRRDRRRRHDRERDHRRDRERNYDGYYDRYGGSALEDPYQLQLQQQQQMYRYYENLRLTDPAAYMLVYKKLMAGHPLPPPPSTPLLGYGSVSQGGRDERGSVHSGRSSANGLSKDTDFNTDASLNLALEESTVRSDRMTPYKFCTAHVKGSVSSHHLVLVRGSYPVDGLPATVAVLSLSAAMQRDPHTIQLQQYPGPLVKGVTHKKSVVEYCEARVREAGGGGGRDLPGYVLLWELLILLLRQNGVVVGTDVAELLLRNEREYEYPRPAPAPTRARPPSGGRRDSQTSSESAQSAQAPPPAAASSPGPAPASTTEAAALDKYREYLLYGNHKDALEWAMSAGLWGHALHLATTLADRRARAAVSARFLAALPASDPLHTLYSIRAGRQATPWCGEERGGDWRPHLAILLSNTSARPDLDQRAITVLGDGLAARGLPYAAQFCYVMARVEFGRHPLAPLAPLTTAPPAAAPPRLTLLCAPPRASTLHDLAATRNIAATEIYEYACSLSDDNFILPELQVYKWVLACRLVDCGQYERALLYTEQISRALLLQPALYSNTLVKHVATMAERLKYADPTLGVEAGLLGEVGEGESAPSSPARAAHASPAWLHQLSALAQQQQHYTNVNYAPEMPRYEQERERYEQDGTYGLSAPDPAPVPAWHSPHLTPQHMPHAVQQPHEVVGETEHYSAPAQPPPPPSTLHQQQQEGEMYPHHDYLTPAPDNNDNSTWDPYPHSYAEEAGAGGEEARPHITMPGGGGGGGGGARRARGGLYDDDELPPPPRPADTHEQKRSESGEEVSQEDEGGGGGGGTGGGKPGSGGWLDGLLSKISLKPKNQMILPDDKNPTIVWDEDRKRWRNLDGDENEREGGPPPPPTNTLLAAAQSGLTSGPPGATQTNMFKMQKGRHIKKSYVDVFNPSGAPAPAPPAPSTLLPPAPPAPPTTYFVPSLQQ